MNDRTFASFLRLHAGLLVAIMAVILISSMFCGGCAVHINSDLVQFTGSDVWPGDRNDEIAERVSGAHVPVEAKWTPRDRDDVYSLSVRTRIRRWEAIPEFAYAQFLDPFRRGVAQPFASMEVDARDPGENPLRVECTLDFPKGDRPMWFEYGTTTWKEFHEKGFAAVHSWHHIRENQMGKAHGFSEQMGPTPGATGTVICLKIQRGVDEPPREAALRIIF